MSEEELPRKVEAREKEIEKRYLRKEKTIDYLKVVEDVFDARTVKNVIELMRRRVIDELYGAVAQGKEGKVFLAKSPKGEFLAVKIFYVTTAEFIRGRYKYILGDPRFERISRNPWKLIIAWTQKEFRNLKIAYEAGVRVPKPIAVYENVLVMEFIGRDGKPAPLIKDAPPEDPDKAYWTIIEYVWRAWCKGKIVHADLSEYNVMNNEGELVIIDWGSAVKASHPLAVEFLKRDIQNITRYFAEIGADVSDETAEKVFRLVLKCSRPPTREEVESLG